MLGRYVWCGRQRFLRSFPQYEILESGDVLVEGSRRQTRRLPVRLLSDCYGLAIYGYVSVDPTVSGTNLRIKDLSKLTRSDSFASCIMSLNRLEHVEDSRTSLAKCYQVLVSHRLVVCHIPCYCLEKETSALIKLRGDLRGCRRDF